MQFRTHKTTKTVTVVMTADEAAAVSAHVNRYVVDKGSLLDRFRNSLTDEVQR